MKMLTEAEHNDLLTAKAERDDYARAMQDTPIDVLVRTVLVEVGRSGLVLTVEQQPLRPLAMGNHRTLYSLRAKRAAA